jgi:hypothetical protein
MGSQAPPASAPQLAQRGMLLRAPAHSPRSGEASLPSFSLAGAMHPPPYQNGYHPPQPAHSQPYAASSRDYAPRGGGPGIVTHQPLPPFDGGAHSPRSQWEDRSWEWSGRGERSWARDSREYERDAWHHRRHEPPASRPEVDSRSPEERRESSRSAAHDEAPAAEASASSSKKKAEAPPGGQDRKISCMECRGSKVSSHGSERLDCQRRDRRCMPLTWELSSGKVHRPGSWQGLRPLCAARPSVRLRAPPSRSTARRLGQAGAPRALLRDAARRARGCARHDQRDRDGLGCRRHAQAPSLAAGQVWHAYRRQLH